MIVSGEPSIRVTVSDDHAILRAGLRAVIADKDDVTVVGEADTAQQTVELVRTLRPDVAIVDLVMGDASAIDILQPLLSAAPMTRVLVLTMHAGQDMVRDVLQAGAHGYVTKDAHHEEVVAAIRTLAAGRAYVSIPVGEGGLKDLVAGAEQAAARQPGRPLSTRERQVLALFARGQTHREIAEVLGVRLKTVETYRSRLGDKLGARSRDDLVRCAGLLGLLDGVDSPLQELDVPQASATDK